MAFPEKVNMSVHVFIHSSIKHALSIFFQVGDNRQYRDDETIYSAVEKVDMREVQVTPLALGYSCLRALGQLLFFLMPFHPLSISLQRFIHFSRKLNFFLFSPSPS